MMKIYVFVRGLLANDEPDLFVTPCNYPRLGWTLIDTREIHFNLSDDEILRLAKEAQAEVDKVGASDE